VRASSFSSGPTAPSASSCLRMYWRTCSQFEPDGRYRITAGPNMLAAKTALPAAEASDGDRTLPLQKSDHRRDRMLGRNRDAHVDMVRHEVPLDDLALLCRASPWKIAPSCRRVGRKWLSAASWGTNTTWYLQSHCEWVSSDKRLTYILSCVASSSHLGRILLRERSNLFSSHWSNQWLTNFSYLVRWCKHKLSSLELVRCARRDTRPKVARSAPLAHTC
jgi:hypothetical protein